jgi:RecA-family ATPase
MIMDQNTRPPERGDENADQVVTPAGVDENISSNQEFNAGKPIGKDFFDDWREPLAESEPEASAQPGPAGPAEANRFLNICALGYHRLCSVVPPNAPLSENSSLWKRMRKNASADSRGKVPGLRGKDGKWYGYDFVKHESTLADVERWGPTGASVGVKTGQGLYALDADTYDKASAKIIHDAIVRRFGDLPARIEQYPKALYLIRTTREMLYKRIEFGAAHHEGKQRGKLKDRLEVLGEGRQFVAHGIHPKTMEPYRWVPGMPAYADIPVVDPSEIDALLEELRGLLPAATPVHAEGGMGDSDVPQELLKGALDEVRRAIRALPNTSELFPQREDYLQVGYMVKASLPDHPEEAFELFMEWAEKWEDGVSLDEDGNVTLGNDPDIVRSDWDRMQPPFRAGSSKLYDLSTKLSDGAYVGAERWLEDESADGDLFPPFEAFAPARTLNVVSAAALALRPRPERDWHVPMVIPHKTVTSLYADGGIGKTLLILQLATSTAAGKYWLRMKVKQGPVLFLSAEEEEDEMHRRLDDICVAEGIEMKTLANLHILSLAGEDALLAALDGRKGVLKATLLFEAVERLVAEYRPRLIIIDTAADVFGGDEINRGQVRQFITLLRGLALKHDATVVLLAHPSVAGMQSGSGLSGSTAWNNSVRSRLVFERVTFQHDRKTVEPNPNLRRLKTVKANYGPLGQEVVVRWEGGRFRVEDPVAASEAASGALAEANAKVDALFCELLAIYTARGQNVSISWSRTYAPALFAKHDKAAGVTKEALEGAMNRLIDRDVIYLERFGPPSTDKRRLAFKPVDGDSS